MAEYYSTRPQVVPTPVTSNPDPSITVSDFDRHREMLLSNDVEEGWVSELRRYLKTMHRDIKKDADIVEWWQVSSFLLSKSYLTKTNKRTMLTYTLLSRVSRLTCSHLKLPLSLASDCFRAPNRPQPIVEQV